MSLFLVFISFPFIYASLHCDDPRFSLFSTVSVKSILNAEGTAFRMLSTTERFYFIPPVPTATCACICLSWPCANWRKYCKQRYLQGFAETRELKHCNLTPDVLERFYGDKCVNYRALRETIAKRCKHIEKTRDLKDFAPKKIDNGANCCLDSFSGRRRRGYWNPLAWEAPTKGKIKKNTHWKDPTGGKPPLAPVTDQSKSPVWAATPRKRGEYKWIFKRMPQMHWRIEVSGTQNGRPLQNTKQKSFKTTRKLHFSK